MICCAFVHGTTGEHDDDFDHLGHGEASFTFPPTFGVTQGLFTTVRKQPRAAAAFIWMMGMQIEHRTTVPIVYGN